MRVTKCDICKKGVDRKTIIDVNVGFHTMKEFCNDCGLPVLKFLKKYKFIKKEGKEYKNI